MALPAFLAPLALPAAGVAGRRGVARRDGAAAACPRRRAVVAMSDAKAAKKRARNWSPRVENRIARMRYEFLELYECGVELLGTEIKSVRGGSLNIKEGYARVKDGELFLHNVHITPWQGAGNHFNHEALRTRRLLLHKRDIRKLAGRQADTGLTIVPTKAYFNKSGYLKIEIALARGKQLHDRREDIKKREGDREMQAIVKASMGGS
jgi:SsrA-binding protein